MLIQRFPSRAAWLASRMPTVGGSDAPVILGLSPYTTPLALWSRKVGIIPPDPETPRMRLGSKLEGAILDMLADEAGVYIEHERNATVTHPLYPELTYSPDGFVMPISEGMDEPTVLAEPLELAEAKNRAGFGAAAEWTEEIPRDVYAQVQHGMDVCDLPSCIIGVLLSGGEFRWARVKRDIDWIEANRPKLLDFARRVREEDPPEPTGHEEDRKAIVARFPVEDAGKVVPLPGEAIDLAMQYRDAQDAAKRAKLAADECANKLALMLGDAETGIPPSDFGKITFKTTNCPARVQEAYSFRSPRVWLKKEKAHGG